MEQTAQEGLDEERVKCEKGHGLPLIANREHWSAPLPGSAYALSEAASL